eukprot:1190701-Rhodomonas_salina.1
MHLLCDPRASSLRACYALPGTHVRLSASYARAMRCLVLTSDMSLRAYSVLPGTYVRLSCYQAHLYPALHHPVP